MSLLLRDTQLATSEDWHYIWKNCDYATYFHSHEWAYIWQEYTGGNLRPEGKIITFSDNSTVLLPFSVKSFLFGGFKRYISSPAGTFGGWLSLNSLTDDHGSLLYQYIVANYKDLIWRLNPYDPTLVNTKVDVAIHDNTQVLRLDSGFDLILESWTKGHASVARKARKARKAGVEVIIASSIQDWKNYYGIYEDSLSRWGTSASSSYKWRIFQSMFDLMSPNIKLWLAIYQNKVVSGALCFYAKKHVVYWHGASLSEYFNVRPVNLLMYEIIKDSCEHGYQWFDFNPSGGHENVEKFKSSFGSKKVECPIFLNESKIAKMTNHAKKILRGL